MTSRDFAFWLQGYLEIAGDGVAMTPAQVDVVRKHLAMVFVHEIDPSMPSKKLDEIHALPPHLRPQDPSKPVMRC